MRLKLTARSFLFLFASLLMLGFTGTKKWESKFVKINTDGTLKNDYRLYSEHVDVGNGEKYREIVNWAGGVPTTVRVDGFESVDFYACNAREIIPPKD